MKKILKRLALLPLVFVGAVLLAPLVFVLPFVLMFPFWVLFGFEKGSDLLFDRWLWLVFTRTGWAWLIDQME